MQTKVAKVYSAQVVGLSGEPISIETDVTTGLYSFTIVGLPDKSVDESRERVHAALKNSGLDSPKSRNHKLTVSLAPAEIKKEGAMFDVPIAISYLMAVGDIDGGQADTMFVGELSLSGDLQPLRGALAIASTAKQNGFKKIILPFQNRDEAGIVDELEIYGAKNINE
jgi:magnesium chelatase family protein